MSFRVVVLAGKTGSLKQAETFLRNRNWQFFTTTSLRECIAAVVKSRPDFVLIAADHPNRKVKALPKLLGQAISVNIIAFVETTNGNSMGALNEMKMDYNLYPPVSGPAVERMCLKIRKEQEDLKNGIVRKERAPPVAAPSVAEQLRNKTPTSSGKQKPTTTTVKSQTLDDFESFLDEASNANPDNMIIARGGDQGGSSIIQPGHGPGDQHNGTSGGGSNEPFSGRTGGDGSSEALGSLAGPSGADDDFDLEKEFSELLNKSKSDPPAADNNPGNMAYMPNHSEKPTATGPGFFPKQDSQGAAARAGIAAKKRHYSELESNDAKNRQESQKPLDPKFDDEKQNHDPFAADWRTDENGNPIEQMDNNVDPAGPRGKGVASVPTSQREDQKVPIMESDPIADKDIPKYKQDPKKYPDAQSIFVRGTQEALDAASKRVTPLKDYKELGINTHVSCLIVESARFSGYLVTAMGSNQKIDQSFNKTVRDRLFEFLRSHGENIKDDAPMDLKLEEVEFEDWAIQHAEFLRKSVHGSTEVAMAFFPSKETSTRLEASVTDNMLKMSLDELKDNVPVEFDLYIYMPSNNRFLLYTPQGRPIYGEQRGRLREKGVSHIHLRADAAGQVKKYRAQVFLNDRIAELKSKRRRAG